MANFLLHTDAVAQAMDRLSEIGRNLAAPCNAECLSYHGMFGTRALTPPSQLERDLIDFVKAQAPTNSYADMQRLRSTIYERSQQNSEMTQRVLGYIQWVPSSQEKSADDVVDATAEIIQMVNANRYRR